MSYERKPQPKWTRDCMPARIFRIFTLLIALSALPAMSEGERTTITLGGGQDGSNPIVVTADSASFGGKNQESRFWGNVEVDQGDLKLRAWEVTVRTNPDNRMEVETVKLSGEVHLTTEGGTAQAEAGVYDVEAKLVTLTSQVVVNIHEQDARITGEMLTYNVETGETFVVGGS